MAARARQGSESRPLFVIKNQSKQKFPSSFFSLSFFLVIVPGSNQTRVQDVCIPLVFLESTFNRKNYDLK